MEGGKGQVGGRGRARMMKRRSWAGRSSRIEWWEGRREGGRFMPVSASKIIFQRIHVTDKPRP